MKILHVYKDFDPPVQGGIEAYVAGLCRHQRKWAEVAALTCSRSVRTRFTRRDGTDVTEVGEWGRFQGAPVSPAFPWQMHRADADVVVIHLPNPTAEIGWLLARSKATLVVRYHSDVVRQARAMRVYGPVQRRLLQQAALILPTSPQYLETSATLAPHRARCQVVPLGIEAEAFSEPDEMRVAELQARYGSPFVLFSGKHRYYKGLPHLVEAAAHIDCPVVIAGDGPERSAVMALAKSQGVPIQFPGKLSQADLVAHLHACAVFAFPSVARSEAFGISIMEAHAAGRPVVATRLGTGVEYINQDEQTGFNVTPGDGLALAEAINRLLADPQARQKMGRHARERVNSEFQIERQAEREWQCYQDVAG